MLGRESEVQQRFTAQVFRKYNTTLLGKCYTSHIAISYCNILPNYSFEFIIQFQLTIVMLGHHLDPEIREIRSEVTGNTDQVYGHGYDLKRYVLYF